MSNNKALVEADWPAARRPRRVGWPHAVAAAALAAVAVAAVVSVLAGSRAIVVGDNLFVNDAGPAGLVEANSSPGLARNPADPDQVVSVGRIDQPRFSAQLHHSGDGGRRWQTTALPLPGGLDRPYAPDAAFGADGTLYVVYVNLVGNGNVPDTLWLSTSGDGGATLSAPVRIADGLTFQARVTVGGDGAVHVSFLRADGVGTLTFTGPVTVMAVTSVDGGATFSDPVPVSDAPRQRVGAASPVVTGDGDLVVVYQDYTDDVRDFSNLDGPVWDGPAALVVARSDDAGAAFGSGMVVDDGLVPAKRFLPYLPEFPSVAAGPGDVLYVAWADARSGNQDVFLRRSDDGGRTWRPRVAVTGADMTGNGGAGVVEQYLPAVSVAASGRVDLAYYARQADRDQTAVELATSTDGGRTFRTVAVSSDRFDGTVGQPLPRGHVDPNLGSRLAVSSQPDGALAVWTDTRAGGDPSLGRQDLVAAHITIPSTASMGQRAWLAVAALVAAAGVLGVGWWRGGRLRG